LSEANPFEIHAVEYDTWFDAFPHLVESEALALIELLPPPGDWLEVGIGSGRFAERLGIRVGVEPAEGMADLARRRGLRVLSGVAESLPFPEASFDAVFLITALCFVQDMDAALGEAARVLRPGGYAILAFIPRDSAFGALYSERPDRFFRSATLRTSEAVSDAVETAGLYVERVIQTLTGEPETAGEQVEPPSEGCERGSFVVVRARRPS